jgi:hypothetical protein
MAGLISNREITLHTVIYGVHIRFWPTLKIFVSLRAINSRAVPLASAVAAESLRERERGNKSLTQVPINTPEVDATATLTEGTFRAIPLASAVAAECLRERERVN